MSEAEGGVGRVGAAELEGARSLLLQAGTALGLGAGAQSQEPVER